MNPRVKIAAARTPSGSEMVLYQHDRDFSITIDGQDLMNSRQHASELALARLGCAHLADHKAPRILIGGLGMGYTLRQALDMLSLQGQVVVSELLGAVVEWNRTFFGDLNGRPLGDERVTLKTGDVVELISRSKSRFDAILLDIDNGPSALTDTGNRRLYGQEGLQACRRALRQQGCLAVWSAVSSRKFEQLLMRCNFHVRRFRVPAYKGSKSQSRFVWVASEDEHILPPGGGEPRRPSGSESMGRRRRPRKRR
jgi:spermidine synthase